MLGLKLFFGDKHSERVFIRVDASSTIGIGHLMRCLTLANHLAETSFEVTFILSSHSAQSVHLIEKNGFEFFIIECDAVDLIMSGNELLPWNWQDDATRTSRIIRQAVRDQNVLLIVDHYQLDAKWEHALRPLVSKLVIIDDLANREHDCDILIDSNSVLATRYTGLVPAHCHQLLGQTYAMIRADVTHLRKDEFEIREEIKTIIVFMGGGDFNNSTLVV
ncbi:MAG: UDP-2,4-diacetamido-2,4,6-trideoxy-beta-L-altropyranose hydrolase, partial [Alphaproteobacteria bacterium]|nr:UDP-2,4-diacetamido-2,4,6-trideoxy-beta-L-altropyranose hydrolase [Alphaproteobacteria bacterium]